MKPPKLLSKKEIGKKVFNNQGFTLGFDFNKICKLLIISSIHKFKFAPKNFIVEGCYCIFIQSGRGKCSCNSGLTIENKSWL